jgi:hypothetical protein
MSALSRVMKAYSSKHQLSSAQAAFVRDELSKFIEELMSKHCREPSMLPETNLDAKPHTSQQRDGTTPVTYAITG